MSDPNNPPPQSWNTQPPAGGPPYTQGGGAASSVSDSGFFSALFDLDFATFVTPKIVKVVYILAIVGLVLGYLFFVVTGFIQNIGIGLMFLILGAVGLIVYLALIRMTLEFYYALIRMSEDIHRRLPGA